MGKVKRYIQKLATTNRVFVSNKRERRIAFEQAEKLGVNSIPIFIINYNRLDCLKKLIARLEELGTTNINIIDNASTYPPLLEYYDQTDYKVFRLDKNWGHMVFWNCDIFKDYRDGFFVLTDSDVVPTEDCPNTYLETFLALLKKYPRLRKVGFSLKLDDLPEDGILSKDAITWESQFYERPLPKDNAYIALIDTTFAMYAPERIVTKTISYVSLRTASPIEARHLPWYKRKEDITEEDVYYSQNKENGWWDAAAGNITPDTEEEKELISRRRKGKL